MIFAGHLFFLPFSLFTVSLTLLTDCRYLVDRDIPDSPVLNASFLDVECDRAGVTGRTTKRHEHSVTAGILIVEFLPAIQKDPLASPLAEPSARNVLQRRHGADWHVHSKMRRQYWCHTRIGLQR